MENIFKKRLSEELKAKSMTRQDLADLIDVTAEMVTQYLTTKKLPSLETFAKICQALEVSADYMLGLKD